MCSWSITFNENCNLLFHTKSILLSKETVNTETNNLSKSVNGKDKKLEISITIDDEVRERVDDIQNVTTNTMDTKKKEATSGWGGGFTKNKKRKTTPSMIKKQLEEKEREEKKAIVSMVLLDIK